MRAKEVAVAMVVRVAVTVPVIGALVLMPGVGVLLVAHAAPRCFSDVRSGARLEKSRAVRNNRPRAVHECSCSCRQ